MLARYRGRGSRFSRGSWSRTSVLSSGFGHSAFVPPTARDFRWCRSRSDPAFQDATDTETGEFGRASPDGETPAPRRSPTTSHLVTADADDLVSDSRFLRETSREQQPALGTASSFVFTAKGGAFSFIIVVMVGVDEVGRGCVAGPLLVVAARAKGELPAGLKDSKLLTQNQRQLFYNELTNLCDWGQGWVTAAEINSLGLAKCLKLGVSRAIKDLGVDANEQIIMDGVTNYVPTKYISARAEAKADNNYSIVSAASILAKVTRDNFMASLAKEHPNYGFDQHVGYGTAGHLRAIEEFGVLDGVHRTIFANFAQGSA